MTGFAALEADDAALLRAWEIRSVNGRGLDLRLRLPDGLGALDAPLRKAVSTRLTRGSVTIGLRLNPTEVARPVRINPAVLTTTLDALATIQGAAAQRGVEMRPSSPTEVMALKGVADSAAPAKMPDQAVLMGDVEALLDRLVEMREAEGAALKTVLNGLLDRVSGLLKDAAQAVTARGARQSDRLRANLAVALSEASQVEPDRLAQELALIAMKSDVSEELDRLTAHVDAARALLATGGAVGRKLDFLMQEFNREANTLCSKSGDVALTGIGLDLKLAIDQMREQIQNLE